MMLSSQFWFKFNMPRFAEIPYGSLCKLAPYIQCQKRCKQRVNSVTFEVYLMKQWIYGRTLFFLRDAPYSRQSFELRIMLCYLWTPRIEWHHLYTRLSIVKCRITACSEWAWNINSLYYKGISWKLLKCRWTSQHQHSWRSSTQHTQHELRIHAQNIMVEKWAKWSRIQG